MVFFRVTRCLSRPTSPAVSCACQVYNDVVSGLGRFGKDVEDIDVAELRKKSDGLRLTIEELEKSSDEQAKSALHTHRKKLEWYQMQIDYAEGSTK